MWFRAQQGILGFWTAGYVWAGAGEEGPCCCWGCLPLGDAEVGVLEEVFWDGVGWGGVVGMVLQSGRDGVTGVAGVVLCC